MRSVGVVSVGGRFSEGWVSECQISWVRSVMVGVGLMRDGYIVHTNIRPRESLGGPAYTPVYELPT